MLHIVVEEKEGSFELPETISTPLAAREPYLLLSQGRTMMKPAYPEGTWERLNEILTAYRRQVGSPPAITLEPCGPIEGLNPGDKVYVLCSSDRGVNGRVLELRPGQRATL